jgi:hypothetical protein
MAPILSRFYGGSAAEWQSAAWTDALLFFNAIPHVTSREAGGDSADLPADIAALLDRVTADAKEQLASVATRAPKTPPNLGGMGIKVTGAA